EARPAIGCWALQTEPAALADGEAVHSVMAAQHLPGLPIDQLTRPGPQPAGEEGPGVAGGDEADVMAVRLARDGQAPAIRLGADAGLDGVTDWEQGMGQLVCGEPGQHIGLVLAGVHGPA